MRSAALFAVAAAVPFVAAQSLTVTSYCSFPIYLWNVLNDYGTGPPDATLQPGSTTWSGSFQSKTANGAGGGASVKLKLNNNIFDGEAVSQAEYKMTDSTLFFDWSLINGNIVPGQAVSMGTSNPSCPSVDCLAGSSYCPGAYYHPDDVATLACDGQSDLFLTLCGSGSGGSGGSSGASSPAPVSTPSAAPSPPPAVNTPTPAAPSPSPPPTNNGAGFLEGQAANGDPVATVIATTIVSVTVTHHMPAATAKAREVEMVEEDKREPHLHEHQHRGVSRVMGRHNHA